MGNDIRWRWVAAEVTRFLTHLAAERDVAASTQNHALSALLFLYSTVLEVKLPRLGKVQRATRPMRLPVVLTKAEVKAVLEPLKGNLPGRLRAKSALARLSCRGAVGLRLGFALRGSSTTLFHAMLDDVAVREHITTQHEAWVLICLWIFL
ncbi:MAG TPA: phage integrase N-terminal SAM-like domain-containing protein [Chthoniobacterales bacterium]